MSRTVEPQRHRGTEKDFFAPSARIHSCRPDQAGRRLLLIFAVSLCLCGIIFPAVAVLPSERLAAGDSDGEVLVYLTGRYGDYVLLRPPIKPATWVLWFGPPAFLLAGVIGGVVTSGHRRSSVATETAALSEEERRRLVDLMMKGAVQ
jgi:hypothetical protein